MDRDKAIVDVLQSGGRRVTSQRLMIHRVLQGNLDHPTAEEVYAAVRAILPSVSLATVYKVLNEFVDLGVLHEVERGDGPVRFDADTSPHIHLRCMGCGRLLDLPESEAPVAVPETAAGYRILGYNLTLEGRCPDCQDRIANRPPVLTTHD